MLRPVIAYGAGPIARILFGPVPAFVFFKVARAVDAFTPPARLQGRDQARSGAALAFDTVGGRP
jgi:hypothetical protein